MKQNSIVLICSIKARYKRVYKAGTQAHGLVQYTYDDMK